MHIGRPQDITLCCALNFLALLDFFGGFHLGASNTNMMLEQEEEAKLQQQKHIQIKPPEITAVDSQSRLFVLSRPEMLCYQLIDTSIVLVNMVIVVNILQ